MREATAFLQAALDTSVGASNTSQDSWIDVERNSRVLFISGTRGVGKSTFLVSLAAMTDSRYDGPSLTVDDPLEGAPAAPGLSGELVWVEPIDLEPAPDQLNMLVAILVRIVHVVEAQLVSQNRPMLDSLRRLKGLQVDLARSWEHDPLKGLATSSSREYAEEVVRIEETRVNLRRHLDQALEDVVSDVYGHNSKMVFVVSVDDFDLKPAACLDVMRLIRLVSSRRIFTVIFGDLEIADVAVKLQIHRELAGAALGEDHAAGSPVSAERLGATAARIAAHGLRKMLPPQQRVYLKPLSVPEALQFTPGPGSRLTAPLADILAMCPLKVTPAPNTLFPGEPIETLADLLAPPGTVLSMYSADIPSYAGQLMLSTTPRKLSDLYLRLATIAQPDSKSTDALGFDISEEQSDAVLPNALASHARRLLAEDPAVPLQTSERTIGALQEDNFGQWHLERLGIGVAPYILQNGEFEAAGYSSGQIESVLTSSRDLDEKAGALAGEQGSRAGCGRVTLKINKSEGWRLFYTSNGEGRSRTLHGGEKRRFELNPDTTGALISLHDTLALRVRYDEWNFPFFKEGKVSSFRSWRGDISPASGWVTSQWKDPFTRSVEVGWLEPPCLTFWGYDRFLRLFRARVRDLDREGDSNGDQILAAWILAGLESITSASIKEPLHMDPRPDWTRVTSLLCDEFATQFASRRQQEIWIVRVFILAMPETGATKALVNSEKALASTLLRNRRSKSIISTSREFIKENRLRRMVRVFGHALPSILRAGRPAMGGHYTPTIQQVDKLLPAVED